MVRGELDVQAVFLAGKNDGLRLEAESVAAQAKFPVKVIELFRQHRAIDAGGECHDLKVRRPDHI
ncbi:MAG: hypothetical protein WKF84_12915 [Pyrinomonadaceae bacterium]